ncbi:MAG: hypothetical protein U0931_33165 [Vulcanimicrobiota bacterium]
MQRAPSTRLEEWLGDIHSRADGTASNAALTKMQEVLEVLAQRFPRLCQPIHGLVSPSGRYFVMYSYVAHGDALRMV